MPLIINAEEIDNNELNKYEGKTRILWIRHAQSVFNAEYEKNGYTQRPTLKDSELTEKGIDQAKAIGKEIGEYDYRFDLAIVSPLRRAFQTYQNSGLRERAKKVIFTALCREHVKDPSDVGIAEIFIEETDEALAKRKDEFIEFLFMRPENTIVVVSHSEFIHACTGIWLDNATGVWTLN